MADTQTQDQYQGINSTSEMNTWGRSYLWANLAYHMTPCVTQVVEFAKNLPGFPTLIQDDQLILIKVIDNLNKFLNYAT